MLGVLVVLVVRTRAGAAAALVATTAVLVRWGGPELGAVGGGQAVLGPAVAIGTTAAAASSVLATLALALLAPRSAAVVVALGVVAGGVAAGPEIPHDLPVRAAGVVVAIGLAYGARWVPFRQAVAVALAVVALVLAGVS